MRNPKSSVILSTHGVDVTSGREREKSLAVDFNGNAILTNRKSRSDEAMGTQLEGDGASESAESSEGTGSTTSSSSDMVQTRPGVRASKKGGRSSRINTLESRHSTAVKMESFDTSMTDEIADTFPEQMTPRSPHGGRGRRQQRPTMQANMTGVDEMNEGEDSSGGTAWTQD